MLTSINSFAAFANISPWLIAILAIWSLIWKGLALWKAASLRQKYWFIALLIINTLGILEIIYYFFVSKNYKVEVVEN
ncbi:MAG: DUF5652 family protein [Patescibacteria group bacterium]